MSECQVSLNKFLKKYKEDSGSLTNQRKVDSKAEISDDDELDATQVGEEDHKAFRSTKAPQDASGCSSV